MARFLEEHWDRFAALSLEEREGAATAGAT
jgi:hypothetical protein